MPFNNVFNKPLYDEPIFGWKLGDVGFSRINEQPLTIDRIIIEKDAVWLEDKNGTRVPVNCLYHNVLDARLARRDIYLHRLEIAYGAHSEEVKSYLQELIAEGFCWGRNEEGVLYLKYPGKDEQPGEITW